MKTRLNLFLSLSLLGLGLLEPVGHVLKWDTLRQLGRVSGASVLPLVFNEVDGVEFWANRYWLEYSAANGATMIVPVSRDILAKIRGPHVRTAAYVVPLGFAPISGESFYGPPLRYGLCNGGPLARDLGFEEEIDHFRIHILSGTPGTTNRWSYDLSCEHP